MKEFCIYFFGQGTEVEFSLFTLAHFAPIVLMVLAYYVNTLLGLGANYLYMARPEAAPSVLDILPPNFTLCMAVMAAVITLMYALAYLPWYLKDKKEKAALSA